MDEYYIPASPEHIKRERQKARELRQTQWWRQILGAGLCYYCEKKFAKEDLSMDHKVPLARGGRSTKGNIVPACKDCNTSKSTLTPAEIVMKNLDPTPADSEE